MFLRRAAGLVALALITASPAGSDVTVCEGDDCTVVSGGVSRKLTADQVREQKRSETRQLLYRVDCDKADVPPACRVALQDLIENFQ